MNRLKTFLLLGLVTALLAAFGVRMGTGWLAGSIVAAFALNLGAYFWSHKLVLRMQGALALQRLGRGQDPDLQGPTAQPATASLMIASPFAGGGLLRWFSTHPPIQDRVARLRAMAPSRHRAA